MYQRLLKIFEDVSRQLLSKELRLYDFISEDASLDIKKNSSVLVVGFGASVSNLRAILSTNPSAPIYFLDSIDPLVIERTISRLGAFDLIVFISHSGETEEIILLFNKLRNIKVKKIVFCANSTSLLSRRAKDCNIPIYEYSETLSISGRFAVLSKANLLLSSYLGVDAQLLVNSATKYISRLASNPDQFLRYIKWILKHYELNRRTLVMIRYGNSWEGIHLWVQQMIAESLGKNGFGITPIILEGTGYEHSQLELFLGGPDDKIYHMFTKKNLDTNDYFAKTMEAHSSSVNRSLSSRGRPLWSTECRDLSEEVLVEYVISTILMVIVIAKYQGFDPYTQPMVEKNKKLYKLY